MHLFQLFDEPITLRSGQLSAWKIECDSLTVDDWRTLAAMAAEILPSFGYVEPVPNGGIPFADALRFYADPDESDAILIAEDVVTTGGSMEKIRNGRPVTEKLDENIEVIRIMGICVFARGTPPDWVTPLFQMRVQE